MKLEMDKDGKYRTQLKCIICGQTFGNLTIREASERVPICDVCRSTRKKIKMGGKIS